jgi:hypothetical protein
MFVEVKPLSALTPEAVEYWTRQMAVAWDSMPDAVRLWFEGPTFDGQAGRWRRLAKTSRSSRLYTAM